MTQKRKDDICTLLKGIETGDAASVAVVNPDKYIQHNPQTHEGSLGLAALFKELAKSSPKVNIVRVFSDGEFVFGHTEYDFGSPRVGFEIFKFEGDQTVEHWDNIQSRKGPNPSGHSMTDGITEVTDLDQTNANREIVDSFISEVLINGELDKLKDYLLDQQFIEHNPASTDGLSSLQSALSSSGSDNNSLINYEKRHRILADGNFVLSVCEGYSAGVHTSFFDLYRLSNGKLTEHWDTTEAIPPVSEWKNDNGKF